MWRKRVVVLATLLVAISVAAADDPLTRAAARRQAGDLASAITILEEALPDDRAELMLAETLGWAKRFGEAEARYRAILSRTPASIEARLGLAQVLLWQERYGDAAAAYDQVLVAQPENIEALEGRATAAYWSGDLRRAAQGFRAVLARDPTREFSRRSLEEITATMTPFQRVTIGANRDDQPLDTIRSELAATFFSDPLTRWSVAAGGYHLDGERRGTSSGTYVTIGNETSVPRLGVTIGGSIGVLEFPDGSRLPIGSASIRYRSLTLRIDRREELWSATALRTHPFSTAATLRWHRESADSWIAAAEVSRRRYFDGNRGRAAVGYAVAPVVRRGEWTIWAGASAAFRDTDESRFEITAVSSELDASGGFFHYRYRGEYDPYWTPDDLAEARAVVAVERRFGRGNVKFHADGGVARDRGRSFGPDAGPSPFPVATERFDFERRHQPFRVGATGSIQIAPRIDFEAGVERSSTVDYRSTTFHASVVRRR